MENLFFEDKYRTLQQIIRDMNGVVVAFSGGVDSSVLAATAYQVLKESMLAITAVSPVHPAGEAESAAHIAQTMGIPYLILETDEFALPEFVQNTPERCYYCKWALLQRLQHIARENGFAYVIEGANADDARVRRPGSRAVRELGVRSPLQEAGLSKAEIRSLAEHLGLPNWNAPARPCYATRFPYGVTLTPDGIARVLKGEAILTKYGLAPFRLRDHGSIARIEVSPECFQALLDHRNEITSELKRFGYHYLCLDLEGFRSGSMDEILPFEFG